MHLVSPTCQCRVSFRKGLANSIHKIEISTFLISYDQTWWKLIKPLSAETKAKLVINFCESRLEVPGCKCVQARIVWGPRSKIRHCRKNKEPTSNSPTPTSQLTPYSIYAYSLVTFVQHISAYGPSTHEMMYRSILVCNFEYKLGALRYILHCFIQFWIMTRIYQLTNKDTIAKTNTKTTALEAKLRPNLQQIALLCLSERVRKTFYMI